MAYQPQSSGSAAFQGASDFTISGGTFNTFLSSSSPLSIQSSSSTNVPPSASSRPSASESSSKGPSNDTPELPPHKLYAQLLLPRGLGYPLWIPYPSQSLSQEYQAMGVRIGDLGMLNKSGGFDYLFNICHAANDPINIGRVPENFQPVTSSLDIDSDERLFPPGQVVTSSPAKITIELPSEAWKGFTFTSLSNEGALVIFPQGGLHQDLKNPRIFQDYAYKNAIWWYWHVNNQMGRITGDNTLYLITTCVKSPSWGAACFTEANPKDVLLKYSPVVDGSPKHYRFDVIYAATAMSGCDDSFQDRSGCIFLCGYKIAIRPSLLTQLLKAVASTSVGRLIKGWHLEHQAAATREQAWQKRNLSKRKKKITLQDFPKQEVPYHPSDIVNKRILEMDDQTDVAITHDNDWIRVLSENASELPSKNDLLFRIFEFEKLPLDMNRGEIFCETEFQATAAHGSELELQLQITKGADVNAQHHTFGSPLYNAVKWGKEANVELLLRNKACIDPMGGISALVAGASKGYLKIVQLLLDSGADVNATGQHNESALEAAAKNGHLDIVQLLLRSGAGKNAQSSLGSAFQVAVENNHLGIVQCLLDVDGWSTSSSLASGFQTAVKNGHLEIVQLLLNAGASTNAPRSLASALQAAAENGHLDIVQLLLDSGAGRKAQSSLASSLQVAVKNGHLDIVQLLLRSGAGKNAQSSLASALQVAIENGHLGIVKLLLDVGGWSTPSSLASGLQAAVKNGHLDIAQLLLNAGWNTPRSRASALYDAAENGHLDIVQLLLDSGAGKKTQKSLGSALQVAAENGHLDIVQLLLKSGAGRKAQNSLASALQVAAKNGHLDIIQLLLRSGVGKNAQNSLASALQAAVENGHLDIVQLLLKSGADVNGQGSGSVLQAAARKGHLDIVQLLLKSGADVNAKGISDEFALKAAAENGHQDIVQLLLDSGADVKAEDSRSALRVAARNGHQGIVQLLESTESRADVKAKARY